MLNNVKPCPTGSSAPFSPALTMAPAPAPWPWPTWASAVAQVAQAAQVAVVGEASRKPAGSIENYTNMVNIWLMMVNIWPFRDDSPY